ncbi:MAG: exo-alpha-sialidase [Thermoleophilia bacterium]
MALLRGAAAAALTFAVVGPASAATIHGTGRSERLVGTAQADAIHGGAGNDVLLGRGGNDLLDGGQGRDRIVCGAGRDAAVAEAGESVARDCEFVTRRISRDPIRGDAADHATEVEPDSLSVGSKVVATFQVGRYADGGASAIGFATSADAGRTWRFGLLPGLTQARGGRYPRASDPVVAYDAKHGVWLVASLAIATPEFSLAISRSADGIAWEPPVIAFTAPPTFGDDLGLDKEWIVCDNGLTSPFRGRCYVTYTDFQFGFLSTRHSDDGGLTWSAPASFKTGFTDAGPQPLVRPNGELVIAFRNLESMYALRSTTGGESFGGPEQIALAPVAGTPRLRAPSLPSAEIAADGTIYVAWHGCTFRTGCAANDIVVAHSLPAGGWAVSRVPIHPVGSAFNEFTPGIAVEGSRVAVTYYTLRPCGSDCRVDIGAISSSDGGATWSAPQRLNTLSMPQEWLPFANGYFLGDYISTSFAGGRAVGILTLAEPPVGRTFDEAIYATTFAVR